MSRIGKHPVVIPSGVTVTVDGQRVSVQGKLGALERTLMREVNVTREDGRISVKPRDDTLRARMMWGTARTLVANLVNGVSQGFTRKMEITGVGYRAQVQGKQPGAAAGLQPRRPLSGSGRHHHRSAPIRRTSSSAAPTRSWSVRWRRRSARYRPVEPYKGKGIKYEGEFVLRKEGKKK